MPILYLMIKIGRLLWYMFKIKNTYNENIFQNQMNTLIKNN